MSQSFQIVATESLLRSTVFSVERRTVANDRATFDRDVVTHQGAVAIVAVDADGRVGLIRQYRAPFDRFNLEIPAGTLDVADENALNAAKRELLEELGCRAQRWTLLGRFMVSPGWTDQLMTIYEARELTLVERSPHGPEEISASVHWLSVDQVRELLRSPEPVDATTTIGLSRVLGNVLGND